jgi:hypothetical protein
MIDDYISQISDEVANEVGKSIERELKDFI